MRIARRVLSAIVSVVGALTALCVTTPGFAADAPTVKQALASQPQNSDVDIDVPDPKTYDQCKVTLVREGKATGWIVAGPAGQPLRRFMDTNGDNVVDLWCYYKNGLEVYRDIDSNFNNKKDQFRWLNFGGTRWGVDTNEDGKIDAWKQISAEEVSRIAVKALVSQDASILAPLLITKDDLKQLGIKGNLETKLLTSVADPAGKLRKAAANSKIITPRTTWMRFDASPPATVPAESIKASDDVIVYENVMAIVDFGNPMNPGLVHVGELIRLGDVWKMTSLPMPMEGNAIQLEPGIVMNDPLISAGVETAASKTSLPQKEQELVGQLQKLMESSPPPNAPRPALEKHQKAIEAVLGNLIAEVKSDEARNQWTRQLLDSMAIAVQSGVDPSALDRLRKLEAEVSKSAGKSPLAAIARYRVLVADYATAMQESKDDDARQKIHEHWLTDLDDYIDKYPKSDDASEAATQLAQGYEFAGKLEKAAKWYQRVVTDYAETPAAGRAAGALKRLELVGKPLALSGASLAGGMVDIKQFRGKVVCVVFWDTESKLCREDLTPLKALYDTYRADGFEIIGVNLDPAKTPVQPYLTQNGVKWPQIHEPGGPESAPAKEFGITILPTMFIVDRDGKVLSRSANVAELKALLAEKLAKK